MNTAPPEGTLVDVYWNLHKRLWSVRVDGRVVAHLPGVVLECCAFRVSEAGRQRVLASRRKNVHAWVRGTITQLGSHEADDTQALPVRYNPYRSGVFEIGTPSGWRGCCGASLVCCTSDEQRPRVIAYGEPVVVS